MMDAGITRLVYAAGWYGARARQADTPSKQEDYQDLSHLFMWAADGADRPPRPVTLAAFQKHLEKLPYRSASLAKRGDDELAAACDILRTSGQAFLAQRQSRKRTAAGHRSPAR